MNKPISSLLLVVLCACLGLTNALPVRPLPTTDKEVSQTRSPRLRSLILSGNHVSLLPDNPSKYDKDIGSSVQSSSLSQGVDTKLGVTDTTISSETTSINTDSSHSRGARSVTFSDTQIPVEPTTENPAAIETTLRPVQEETTTVPKEEMTTKSWVDPETIKTSSTEMPTTAPAEVVLVQEYLDNASKQVDIVLAKVQMQNKSIGGFYVHCDERARPILPLDVVDNSKQCFQIQSTLQAINEVLREFLSYLNGLIALNGDTTVYVSVRVLDMFITVVPSPSLDYSSAPIQGADTKNTEEVVCTLQALSTQIRVIKQVLLNLKNC